eukprot:CAMPEP_0117422802 /NCGR_PEP_ID=MMETSP0758-20121206/3576_1 /TAXON_ID=63605 /ORGANISM="Percolomonas cosmopolitus, Strain AE-1 (ATCC 50343)" /LENGTH=615 /DNA_ID=CAMNT_0005205655 /DNA_START=125 /DNA_END=1969 /DNA_ORIENTATION=-
MLEEPTPIVEEEEPTFMTNNPREKKGKKNFFNLVVDTTPERIQIINSPQSYKPEDNLSPINYLSPRTIIGSPDIQFSPTYSPKTSRSFNMDTHEIYLESHPKRSKSVDLGVKNNSMKPSPQSLISSDSFDAEPPKGENVVLVFTDIKGSTKLWEKSVSGMSNAIFLHNDVLRDIIFATGGYEVKTEGDAFMVAYENPLKAVEFAVRAQKELLHVQWPESILGEPQTALEEDSTGKIIFNGIRIRIGIHMGNALTKKDPFTDRTDYFGPTVNRAARIESTGDGGQVLLSEQVYVKLQESLDEFKGLFDEEIHIDSLGSFKLRGVEEEATLYQVYLDCLRHRVFGSHAKKSSFPHLVQHQEKLKDMSKQLHLMESMMTSKFELLDDRQNKLAATLGRAEGSVSSLYTLFTLKNEVDSPKHDPNAMPFLDQDALYQELHYKLSTEFHEKWQAEKAQLEDSIHKKTLFKFRNQMQSLEDRVKHLKSNNESIRRSNTQLRQDLMLTKDHKKQVHLDNDKLKLELKQLQFALYALKNANKEISRRTSLKNTLTPLSTEKSHPIKNGPRRRSKSSFSSPHSDSPQRRFSKSPNAMFIHDEPTNTTSFYRQLSNKPNKLVPIS